MRRGLNRGLIIQFEDFIVAFNLVDTRQFKTTALQLDARRHFTTGIPAATVTSNESHASRRPLKRDTLDLYLGLLRKFEILAEL